jgi:SagB-type dehydrogenase family enzyme
MRVVDRVPAHAPDGSSYEGLLRPVPSGGAMHALDLWLVCGGVEGVAPGPWWYDPFDHALVGVDAPTDAVDSYLTGAARAVSGPVALAAALTTREARPAWKYGGIAYALQLKDVGVVMHAVQLTGQALGLGVCPIGSGPTRAVAHLLGIDPEVDAPVGEFLVGRLPSVQRLRCPS